MNSASRRHSRENPVIDAVQNPEALVSIPATKNGFLTL